MPEATAKPLLLLVDGHSLAFRSFYAFSTVSYTHLTLPTNSRV